MAGHMRIVKTSDIWLTSPVPVSDQPYYRNAVVGVETDLAPLDLMKVLKTLEKDLGRDEDIRNAPRVVDLDLIDYHGRVITMGHLTLPHPQMHRRGFVLKPLREVAPDWMHPFMRKSVSQLLSELLTDDSAEPMNLKDW